MFDDDHVAYVWVDALITWQEDLGDRVNTYELSEALAPIYDGMLERLKDKVDTLFSIFCLISV